MFPLIQQANGEGIFWGVLNSAGTRTAIRQLVPEASQFPESGKFLARMKAPIVSVKGTSSRDADFPMISDSPQATTILSQLINASGLGGTAVRSRPGKSRARADSGLDSDHR
jgi:hypothetical protein